MPRGDGTGPTGQGPRTGRGGGQGGGDRGGGRGRMGGNSAGAGLGGECFCPMCGATMPHQRGVPCNVLICPKCGARMTRR
ncbi:MAG: hypothetical protein RBT80_25440 [Candidatus Vecturithrix sp.]|jgi:hypothetical protein|nr:hypothetical protein [Candidatus Vecturithrix sp.]